MHMATLTTPGMSIVIPWHNYKLDELRHITPEQSKEIETNSERLLPTCEMYARYHKWTIGALGTSAGLKITRIN
jgi:hypothetical protein